ncbi:TPA: hypothetical protein ACIJ1F_004732 [Citrobacter freundii]
MPPTPEIFIFANVQLEETVKLAKGAIRSDGVSYAGFELDRANSPYMRQASTDKIIRLVERSFVGIPLIGSPFYWPLNQMPNEVFYELSEMTFLKLNNSRFSADEYPKLALVWPSLLLNDVRGEFIRVWDDGRGVDPGRALLSYQGDAIRNITGSINNTGAASSGAPASSSGVFTTRTANFDSVSSGVERLPIRSYDMNIGSQVPTANENRPRNIAFNFIVRAK